MNPLTKLFSSEKRASRLENKLQRAIAIGDQEKALSAFCQAVLLLVRGQNAGLLSKLVLSYPPQAASAFAPGGPLPHDALKQAIDLLEQNKYDVAALVICDESGHDAEAIDLLAKRGRANDLAMRIRKDDFVDRERLETVVRSWERHNGDIRSSLTMGHMLASIAACSPDSLPDDPRVKELAGQFAEAAALYAKGGDLPNAARCYEEAEAYVEASNLYERLGDNERASRAAEASGDLERALDLVVNPERKARLLVQTERFLEAREFAAGLESPQEIYRLIVERAKLRMMAKARSHDFIAALELAEIAECDPAEREQILVLGRQHFETQIGSAASQEEITSITRDRIRLEEKAGNFVEAGTLAEEVLGDLDLASFLYEKANLFNRAIDAAAARDGGQADTQAAKVRLAELHEKGGNLLRAAMLYEAAGRYEKAYPLYESIQHFSQALECYRKLPDPSNHVLIRLYTGAGEFERVVELYLEGGTLPDLERALSIATTHRLGSHSRVIKERMSAFALGTKEDLERCFLQARDEVRETYPSVIGIDFGTTNSVVAILNKKSGKVEIVPNAQGSAIEPSFFALDEDRRPIFGEAARLRSMTAPEWAAARFKRSLGERATISIGGKHFRCEEIVANVLQHMRSNAERYVQSKIETRLYDLLDSLGLKFPSETLSAYLSEQHGTICFKDVVLSVPAYFNDNQKRATRDSAEIAGLCVQRLLHEPTAAALAYSYQKPYSGKLVVVDLGGGTLDISIVEIAEGVTEVQEVGGDTKLGGSDIDALLVQHVADDIWQRWGIEFSETAHSSEIARLRDACEHLKINLSSLNQDTIKLVHFLNRPVYTFTMTRTELERLSKPVLDRIRATITRTIENHGAGLDHFLLVGNATKMPAVGALVRQTIPARQLAGIDPGTVVATGAALQASIMAGELTQVLVLDVVPYSLGIAAFHGQAEKEAISRLIAANSTIPIAKSSIYSTKWDNQRNAHIKVYQGESPEPLMNYFLGDLVLEGIPPAPAGTPQIEVVFEIGADCILTVTAVDKASGNEQSLRIERAVALSPQEKQDLGNYFAQRERLQSVERELESVRRDIDELRPSCAKAISTAQRSIEDFAVRFHEKVQVHPQLYKVEPEQVREIQEMIIHQDQLTRSLSKYQDQFNSILENIRQIEAKHLDFTDSEIAAKLRARIDSLSHYRQALRHGLDSLETNVVAVLTAWNQILESMEPDSEKMDPLEFANYHLTAGRANQAKEILEALASSADGLTKEAYHLLLKCYVSLGLRDEYRETHRRLGSLFGEIHPEFHRLNTYLKAIADSIFMIQGVSDGSSALAGSGFCITPNLIVTNRHVVQGRTSQQLRIIGKSATYPVERLELDPLDDLAILQVAAQLRPLSLGEFHFVEPGEQVLAIGFPHPDSNIHGENLYISKGIVNSIRKTEISSERVIFIDAKIGGGMSGGPLINELGEVIGVVTSVRYRQAQSEDRTLLVEDQPIALPIHLVRKYVRGTH